MKRLYDKYLGGWRADPSALNNVDNIPDNELWEAHFRQKKALLSYANSQVSKALDKDTLTIGFARRAATYKRAQLIFNDPKRLLDLGRGKIQIVFSGKAHPNDSEGKELIRKIVENANSMFGKLKVVFLENYNMWLGRLITGGVDLWLNTPLRPNEASGTSGMKATLNGIPNLSILDGWWEEGCKEGINGWGIGNPKQPDDKMDAEHLYSILEKDVIPKFYEDRNSWIKIMKESIKTGSDFTSQRMINEYNEKYYSNKGEDI